jgi:SAM-dependent methyltransferase
MPSTPPPAGCSSAVKSRISTRNRGLATGLTAPASVATASLKFEPTLSDAIGPYPQASSQPTRLTASFRILNELSVERAAYWLAQCARVPTFDHYAETYEGDVESSIAFIGQGIDFFTALKARELLALFGRRVGNLAALSLLDVGCGPGATDAYLVDRVASVTGVDVALDMIERAAVVNPGATYLAYDGRRLPFEDGSFDCAFAICVLHHVPPASWAAFVSELVRVTRAHGLAVILEHNPLNPLTRLAVSRCDFDDDAMLLSKRRLGALFNQAGAQIVEDRYIAFFPWEGRAFRSLEHGLRAVPLGAQYFVAARSQS